MTRRRGGPANKIESLLALARKDLLHAEDNVRSHPRHAHFSVQQAAEKMIKAILEREGVSYPATTHQLDDLVSRIPESNPFRGDLLPLTRLTPAATRYRYPTAWGDVPDDPSAQEVADDLAAVKLLLPEVEDWIRAAS
jgi:HEPN domain-containing protein